MTALWDKLYAILRRDLLTAARHRSAFAITAAGLLTQLAAFYFLSRAIGPGFRPDGLGYFPFLLVGTGVFTFFVMSAQAFLRAVQEAQQTGTLEVLMTTSTPPAELVVLSAVSACAGNVVSLAGYLAAGAILFRAPLEVNGISCLIIAFLSLLIALALGITVAAVQIEFQKGSALIWLLSSGVWLLSGTMFPVASLPRPLVELARFIPITYAVDGMRMAILQGSTPQSMLPTVLALLGYSLVLLPIALGCLALSLRRARRNGTLSFY